MNKYISGVVLAGGRSTRMGSDKRLISIGGKTLIQLAIDKLRDITGEVTVVLSRYEELQLSDVKIVVDKEKDKGPIMGILTGLQEIKTRFGLVLACDLPFISTKFLSNLRDKVNNEIDIVVPRWGGKIEPLVGLYSKKCMPSIEDMIKKGCLAPQELLNVTELKIYFVEEKELHLFGDPEVLFFNVNTKEELNEAQKRWKG